MADPFEGKIVLNYRIGEKLGQGAFGSVYRASHTELGRDVAVKILLPQHAARPEVIERFLREARVVCAIGHEDIVTVENAGRLDTGEPFYMMELVEGRSLARVIAEDGPLSPARFQRVFEPLASALAAAHAAGVVHRDLKPQNVMVRERNGAIEGVKLLDFGIAKLVHGVGDDSNTGEALGTPHYMAPEQIKDAKHVDERADVYAFAATAYFALSGLRPFEAGTLPEVFHKVLYADPTPLARVVPHLGKPLSDAIIALLAREPSQRERSVPRAWASIAQAMAGLPRDVAASGTGTMTASGFTPTSPPRSEHETLSRTPTLASEVPATRMAPAKRRPLRWWLLGLAGSGLVAGGLYVSLLRGAEPGQLTRGEIVPELIEPDAAPPPPVIDAAPPPPPVIDAQVVVEVQAVDAAPPVAVKPKRERKPRERKPDPPAPVDVVPAKPQPRCDRARFADVYGQATPGRAQVTDALRALKVCYDAQLISRDDYERIQAALIAKM